MHRKPSAATVLSAIALFFALGGTAIAAHHYLITSTSQIKPGVLHQLRGEAGPAGPQGATGPQGPAGAPGPVILSSLTIVKGAATTVPSKTVGTSTATCPAGSHAVSGGGFGSISGIDISRMSSDHQSWIVAITNSEAITETVEAEAYCATSGQAITARNNSSAHARATREAGVLAAQLEALEARNARKHSARSTA